MPKLSILLSFSLMLVFKNSNAQVIWNSGSFSFTSTASSQDCITAQTCLARVTVLYNAVCETVSGMVACATYNGPCNTEWAEGTINNWSTLTYQRLFAINSCQPPTMVGKTYVVHLIAENIYLQLRFTSWVPGASAPISYIRTTGSVLPVGFISFSGEAGQLQNLLQWVTGTESNNSHFNVQRSTDGVHFSTIARQNSLAQNGNSNSSIEYSYADQSLTFNTFFYRLEQVDLDGNKTYSAITKISNQNVYSSSLSQDATGNSIRLAVNSLNNEIVQIKITDLAGRSILQTSRTVVPGANLIPINFSAAAGSYFLHLYKGEKLSFSGSIVKL